MVHFHLADFNNNEGKDFSSISFLLLLRLILPFIPSPRRIYTLSFLPSVPVKRLLSWTNYSQVALERGFRGNQQISDFAAGSRKQAKNTRRCETPPARSGFNFPGAFRLLLQYFHSRKLFFVWRASRNSRYTL